MFVPLYRKRQLTFACLISPVEKNIFSYPSCRMHLYVCHNCAFVFACVRYLYCMCCVVVLYCIALCCVVLCCVNCVVTPPTSSTYPTQSTLTHPLSPDLPTAAPQAASSRTPPAFRPAPSPLLPRGGASSKLPGSAAQLRPPPSALPPG